MADINIPRTGNVYNIHCYIGLTESRTLLWNVGVTALPLFPSEYCINCRWNAFLEGAHECQRDAVLRDGGVLFLGRRKFNYLKLGPLYKNPVSIAEIYNEETSNEYVT
jgi:hypothetical protein